MRIWATCLILLTSFVFISSSHAALVSYAFTAERSLTLGFPSAGSVAETAAGIDAISGTFSFESATANNGNFFMGDFATGNLVIDQFALPIGGTSNITTTNNFFGSDSLTFTQTNGGLRATFQLIDTTETLLSSLDLPLFLFLTDFVAQIRISDISGSFLAPTVFYDLTSLTAVPIPGALPMLLATLIGGAWISRRRKKVAA